MTINKTIKNGTLIIDLNGRWNTDIDVLFQNTLICAFDESKEILLDFSNLAPSVMRDVSSTGLLRIMLMAQKTAKEKGVSMTLTGVSDEVMKVVEMTGSADILKIKKKV